MDCDVLVVGGGPAGSTCARALRSQGIDVCVMDKAVFPRNKVCAGWVTPPVFESLAIDLDDYAQGRALQPITGFHTGIIGGDVLETRYGRTVSYGIRRWEFDHYLIARAGARLLLGQRLDRLRREGEAWIVNDTIRTPLVVGAGGHFCAVARLMGAKPENAQPLVAAQETEFEMTAAQAAACTVDPEIPELFFCQDLKGYGWCFRKGPFLNIGLGREDSHRLSEHVKEFCEFLRATGKVPFDVTEKFQGHAYLLYRPDARPAVGDGVMLIGDAAGLAYPQSGEGIRPAVESGLMAAQTILEAQGDYRASRLEGYRHALHARFGDRARTGVPPYVPRGLKQFLGGKLLTNRWFTRHVVLDRWFLHADQRPMVATA
ncbi:MAG: NAD(P)/FAD-dependent oxidoreductase [Betaproteobacteria bacterium]|nr:NAD(P)/FAD-dependent oxidoreductase [Betaproteobacteria bacterium]